MQELCGKVTIITGAAAGIGKAAAMLFAREGARLMLSDIDAVGGEALAAQLRDDGHDVHFTRADIASKTDVAALVDATVSAFGRLDCAFNNAGIGHLPVSLVDTSLDMWNRYLAINLTGVFLCMKHQIPVMLANGGGAIVNTGSLAGLAATPMMGPYTASKFGLIGITKSAAAEFAGRHIRVNAVCPTATATEGMKDFLVSLNRDESSMNGPMGRMGRPEEIAEAALWLLSDRASFVTGQAMATTGGSAGLTA